MWNCFIVRNLRRLRLDTCTKSVDAWLGFRGMPASKTGILGPREEHTLYRHDVWQPHE